MIPLLTRHLARAVIGGAIMVLAVLVALDVMFQFFQEIGQTGRGDYTLALAALYIGLEIPGRVYQLFPSAVAVGGVIALGGLAANSELIIMRAAGVSPGSIVGRVMTGGMVLVVVVIAIGELVAPPAQHYAERMRAAAIAGQAGAVAERGIWVRDGDRFINLGTVRPGYVLEDVVVYEFDEGVLRRALHVDNAVHVDDEWRLRGVAETAFDGDSLMVERHAELVWAHLVEPEMFHVLAVSPTTLPIWQLYRYVEHLQRNRLESDRFDLALWKKVTTPLSTLVMLLVALPVVFGSIRATGMGQRIFIGSLIGIGYYLVTELFSYTAIVYGVAAPAAAFMPVVLFAVLALVALRRTLWQ